MSRTQRHQSSFEDDDIAMFDEDNNEIDTNEEIETDVLDPDYGLNMQALSYDDL